MRIKVAHICASGLSIKYLLADQIRYLENLGYEVHTVSSDDIPEVSELGISWQKATISRNISPIRDLQGLAQLVRIFRRENFTIVHTHTPKAVLLGQLAAKIANVPIIIQTLHGFYFTVIENSLWRGLFRRMEIFNCRNAELILSQNPEDIERIAVEKICSPESVQFLGNGIDLDKFTTCKLSNEEKFKGREALGIPGDATVLGIVGRYVEGKGYRELMAASLALRKNFPKLHVLAIGSGSYAERSSEIINPMNGPCGDFWTCLYDRDDMPHLYSLMDVFVLPSYREAFPRSAMEAAASSLPIIATDVRGCRQVVTDGDNGYLVKPRDASALKSGLLKLLNDQAKAHSMGRCGQARALTDFDQRVVFKRVAKAYDDLLNKHGIQLN